MKLNNFRILQIILIIAFDYVPIVVFGQTEDILRILNSKSVITKEQLIKDKETLKNYHPNPFNSFPEHEWDSLIEVIAKELPKEPIPESKKTLIRRKLLDRVTYEDPHVRFLPVLGNKKNKNSKVKSIRVLPISLLNISDTLIVDKSFHPDILRGDRILKVNGIEADNFLESSYRDRYMSGYTLQIYHHFNFAPEYNIVLVRNDTQEEVNIHGFPLTNGNLIKFKGDDTEQRIIDKNEIGYCCINNFSYNKYLVKSLDRFIDKLMVKGYKNLIIDIRKNPGGRGDHFDELISMFTNKKKIPYQSGIKLKVSKATYKDYSYTEEDIGKLIDLPDSFVVKECPLDKSKYKGDINYYVLISRQTASMAATFANIMQYNKIGLLVGEPLAHNALNYGEVITAERGNSFWTISTVQNFEYTNAEDGILKPDIEIPFIAREYMNGGDPVLEKCIELINSNTID
ncbi:S41 family peptidase [Marinifilum caeruleilacunae]|uniref:Tail specific protease domain-containing protein n=1 Tax=Marinifilum caeruleilacunae TaxID=2499076 RepID=A0ABX1X2I8_9BACT|nr:S41 family peptidase [Marinifilum caeruleilacunae]NOU62300.1 hypothetical protein [Marinifilum caeruleilacunae]